MRIRYISHGNDLRALKLHFLILQAYKAPVFLTDLMNNWLLFHNVLQNSKIGKIGLEQLYEHKLRGTAGISHIEVDAHGYVKRTTLPELSQNMIEGENINISIMHHIRLFLSIQAVKPLHAQVCE